MRSISKEVDFIFYVRKFRIILNAISIVCILLLIASFIMAYLLLCDQSVNVRLEKSKIKSKMAKDFLCTSVTLANSINLVDLYSNTVSDNISLQQWDRFPNFYRWIFQIRLLNNEGFELIKVNILRDDIVLDNDLQDKSKRGYWTDYVDNGITITPISFNKENGEFTLPLTLTLRVVKRVNVDSVAMINVNMTQFLSEYDNFGFCDDKCWDSKEELIDVDLVFLNDEMIVDGENCEGNDDLNVKIIYPKVSLGCFDDIYLVLVFASNVLISTLMSTLIFIFIHYEFRIKKIQSENSQSQSATKSHHLAL